MLQADRKSDPHFTQPVRQILMMLMFVVMVGIGAFLGYQSLLPIFMANVALNGFITFVFIFGIIACFWQVFTLVSSVSWIEGFALDRPGHEFVEPPGLLAPLAHLLRKRGARTSLTSSSTQSIQDSVATRLDEGREITRYVINLLIFLGLLGTFYGLATTVPAVVDTIRSLAPQEGASSMDVFDNLMTGLERQLGGMGTAFGSSLLGLAGSLVVGLLDLLAGRGQNRFYRELEEWLSSITRIGVATGEVDTGAVENFAIADMLEHTTYQIENLHDLFRQSQERRFRDRRPRSKIDASGGAAGRKYGAFTRQWRQIGGTNCLWPKANGGCPAHRSKRRGLGRRSQDAAAQYRHAVAAHFRRNDRWTAGCGERFA